MYVYLRAGCTVQLQHLTSTRCILFYRSRCQSYHLGDVIHYRKRLICCVPNSLPCAKRRAHGKQPLCRVPKIKHTANPTHTANYLWLTLFKQLGYAEQFLLGILNSVSCFSAMYCIFSHRATLMIDTTTT